MLPMMKDKKPLAAIIISKLQNERESNQPHKESDTDNQDWEPIEGAKACLAKAVEAMQKGDVDLVHKHLLDWHTIVHQYEDGMEPNSEHGYKEKEY